MVDKELFLQTRMLVYNDADEAIAMSDVIFRPQPGSVHVEKNLFLLTGHCATPAEVLDDLADMDFIFTITMGGGANMFNFETSSGKMITADLSTCNILQSWQEMIENEAISADVLFYVASIDTDVEDYFTTEYKIELN